MSAISSNLRLVRRSITILALWASCFAGAGCNFWHPKSDADGAANSKSKSDYTQRKNWLNMNQYRDQRALEVESHLGG
jgi:hypothetical protein